MMPASLDSIFHKSILYRTLDFFATPGEEACGAVRETGAFSGTACTERHVQCVWYDAALRPSNLASDSGEPVTVVEPGRWNLESGPDFLGATLRVGADQTELKGDVEIHLTPRDWTAHSHGSDPAFSRVIAHVCLRHGARPEALQPHVRQIELLTPLQAEGRSHLQDIDITAYPYSTPAPRPTGCSQAFPELTYDTQLAVLSAAGHARLRLKASRISRLLTCKERGQVLYEETMAALGYKNNRTPFRQLAEAVPRRLLQDLCKADPLHAYALLMGKAGLLPNSLPENADRESCEFLRVLWDYWWRHESTLGADRITGWHTASTRPQNQPARRLAAAACIFCVDETPDEILAPKTAIPYWSRRLSLGGKLQKKPVALLGAERRAAILTNVVAPFTAAGGGDAAHILDGLPPLEFNAVSREMMNSLMGGDYNAAKYRNALIQQGLIQVFSDYCLDPRNSCAECKFAAALQKTSHAQ